MQYTLKKSLGQHFLTDKSVCERIKGYLLEQPIERLVEVGPGAGALTEYIYKLPSSEFKAIMTIIGASILSLDDSFLNP